MHDGGKKPCKTLVKPTTTRRLLAILPSYMYGRGGCQHVQDMTLGTMPCWQAKHLSHKALGLTTSKN